MEFRSPVCICYLLYSLCFVLMLFLVWLLLYCTGVASSVCRFFVFGVIVRRGLKSCVCCSVISLPDRWNSWIYLYSQQFMRPPYYIVLEVLRLFLPVRTHVYSAICDLHKLIADCNFLFD